MGYYTTFRMGDVDPPEMAPTIKARLCELSGYGSPFVEDRSPADPRDPADPAVKWYAWREHCLQVSVENLWVTFTVRGAGEDGSQWASTWSSADEVSYVVERAGDDGGDDVDAEVDRINRGDFGMVASRAAPRLGVPHDPPIDIDTDATADTDEWATPQWVIDGAREAMRIPFRAAWRGHTARGPLVEPASMFQDSAWATKPTDEIIADVQSLIELHRDIGAPKPNTVALPRSVADALARGRGYGKTAMGMQSLGAELGVNFRIPGFTAPTTRPARKWWRG